MLREEHSSSLSVYDRPEELQLSPGDTVYNIDDHNSYGTVVAAPYGDTVMVLWSVSPSNTLYENVIRQIQAQIDRDIIADLVAASR